MEIMHKSVRNVQKLAPNTQSARYKWPSKINLTLTKCTAHCKGNSYHTLYQDTVATCIPRHDITGHIWVLKLEVGDPNMQLPWQGQPSVLPTWTPAHVHCSSSTYKLPCNVVRKARHCWCSCCGDITWNSHNGYHTRRWGLATNIHTFLHSVLSLDYVIAAKVHLQLQLALHDLVNNNKDITHTKYIWGSCHITKQTLWKSNVSKEDV